MLLEPGRILDVWSRFILEEGFMFLEPGILLDVWSIFVLEGFMLLEPLSLDVWRRFVL